jgi:hypothetical protein
MSRLVLACALVIGACVPGITSSPTPTPDIQKGKINIVFYGLVQSSYYKPSGKDLLTSALDALRNEARATGGAADVATPAFDGSASAAVADFRLFTDAAEELAGKNPQLSPRRIADLAIQAMLNVNPDCHNYYVRPRSEAAGRLAAPLAQNRLEYRMIPGGIGHLSWREWDNRFFDDVVKALDELLAQGAKAWVFDVRDNFGGSSPQVFVAYFVNGGPILREVDRDGTKTTVSARPEFYLPARYQLPIAIVVNANSASASEHMVVALQQRGRAKVFGTRTPGCLGRVLPVTLPDGTHVGIVEGIYLGPISDEPINNVGIKPDVEVMGGDPLEAATQYLRSVIR